MSRRFAPTTRAPRRGALFGLGFGALAALVYHAPAAWLAQTLSQTSQARVLLQDARGSLWRGDAQVLLGAGPRAPGPALALPSRLAWQLGPSWHPHWGAGLQAQLQADCCLPPQKLHLSWSPRAGWQLAWEGEASQWPAAWLSGLGAPWNTLSPQVLLRVMPQDVVWTGRANTWRFGGQIQIDWQSFATRLSTLEPLGNYRIVVRGTQAPPTVELSTLQGVLQLRGSGAWRDGRLQFEGEAQAEKEAETALSNLLNVLGQRQGAKSLLRIG